MIEEIKQELTLTKVKSSNIKALGFENEKLYVLFSNNGIYEYTPFKQKEYDEFLKSESIGKYFFAKIRSNKLLKYKELESKKINIKIL